MAIRADNLAGIGFAFVETAFLPASNDLLRRDIVFLMAATTRGIGFLFAALQPASDDLVGRDIMSLVTASTEGTDSVGRVHGLGRGYVVFVVSVCGRLAVAINAADVGLGMAVSEEFDLVVGVAHKAGGVFGCSLGGCNGRSFFGFGWFVKEQWSTCIDYKGRRSLGFNLVVSGRSSLDVGWLRLGCGCAAQEN